MNKNSRSLIIEHRDILNYYISLLKDHGGEYPDGGDEEVDEDILNREIKKTQEFSQFREEKENSLFDLIFSLSNPPILKNHIELYLDYLKNHTHTKDELEYEFDKIKIDVWEEFKDSGINNHLRSKISEKITKEYFIRENLEDFKLFLLDHGYISEYIRLFQGKFSETKFEKELIQEFKETNPEFVKILLDEFISSNNKYPTTFEYNLDDEIISDLKIIAKYFYHIDKQIPLENNGYDDILFERDGRKIHISLKNTNDLVDFMIKNVEQLNIVSAYISYAYSDYDLITPHLNKLANSGINIIIDRQNIKSKAGSNLITSLRGMFSDDQPTNKKVALIFISEKSVRSDMIGLEIDFMKESEFDLIIPIFIGNIEKSLRHYYDNNGAKSLLEDISEETMLNIKELVQYNGKRFENIYNKMIDSEIDINKIISTIFDVYEFDSYDTLGFYFAHRLTYTDSPHVPKEWSDIPILILRYSISQVNLPRFVPDILTYKQIKSGMKRIRNSADFKGKTIFFAGQSFYGFAKIFGYYFNNKTPVEIYGYDFYNKKFDTWSIINEDDGKTNYSNSLPDKNLPSEYLIYIDKKNRYTTKINNQINPTNIIYLPIPKSIDNNNINNLIHGIIDFIECLKFNKLGIVFGSFPFIASVLMFSQKNFENEIIIYDINSEGKYIGY